MLRPTVAIWESNGRSEPHIISVRRPERSDSGVRMQCGFSVFLLDLYFYKSIFLFRKDDFILNFKKEGAGR